MRGGGSCEGVAQGIAQRAADPALWTSLMLNLAACCVKLEDGALACDVCTQVVATSQIFLRPCQI